MDESEPAISANFKFVPIPPRARDSAGARESLLRAIIWASGGEQNGRRTFGFVQHPALVEGAWSCSVPILSLEFEVA